MAIANRNLEPGTRLVGTYKKERYFCTVEAEGDKLVFVVEGKGKFKSPSSAASAVMGGKAVNGWLFWSVEGGEAQAPTESAAEAEKPKDAKAKKVIYRVPNQQGVEPGKTKFWCNACMKSFVADGTEAPEACPQGHWPEKEQE